MGRFTYRLPGASENEVLLARSQKLFSGLAAIGLIVIAVFGNLMAFSTAALTSALALLFQFGGLKLYETETSQNWLVLSLGDTVKSIVGWVLTILGWALLLTGVIVPAVTSLIRRFQ